MMDQYQSQLPEEICMEILERLSVTSLIRFKAVCKSWKSLISTLYFMDHHFDRNAANSNKLGITLMTDYSICLEIWNFSPTSLGKTMFIDHSLEECNYAKVLGWCRGLLLVGVDCSDYKLLLWNPSTRKCKEIPDLQYQQLEYKYIDSSTLGIECFDFAVNKLLVVPQPGDYDNCRFSFTPQLYDTEGSLCIEYRENDGLILEIWVMRRYGVKDSWFKWMSFEDEYVPFPICFAKNNINVSFFVGRGKKCCAIYNGKEKGTELEGLEELAGEELRGEFLFNPSLKKSASAFDVSLICFEHEEVGER
ncbi:hypothetical protein COLO4_15038 [Corchorus olitorius]|uniref:F-box domain-containing protein n=1 Tax=Corchorus olitorius TaxID=93759 RepID=A0A1R3JPU1_9ROSI|nr:hypothetical protein COLO4_15038 [Corchorus olitorius]